MLFDIELYKKVEDECGSYWTGGVDKSLISKFSEKLNVNFPKSYMEFLNKFGEGGICGTYYFGIKREDYASVYNKTIEYRNTYKINPKWIVISDESNEVISFSSIPLILSITYAQSFTVFAKHPT